MINPQWLELPMSRTNFHGPKDVRAIEVRLYIEISQFRNSVNPIQTLMFFFYYFRQGEEIMALIYKALVLLFLGLMVPSGKHFFHLLI